MFNALKYTKDLEDIGFEREQAETLVGMFMQMIEFNMVNKSDFEKFQIQMHNDVEKIDKKIDQKIDKLALQLTIKLGVLLAVSIGILSTILALKL